jgi:uncharacterized protein YndB with AHSA1/START domain
MRSPASACLYRDERRPGGIKMPSTMDERNPGGVSEASLEAATGRGWDGWLAALDDAGAGGWSHKEIVAFLAREHADETTAWWRQTIAVGYERARGKRAVGQTADAGFQVGVQRSVDASRSKTWELLTSRPELWLGPQAAVTFEEGARYEVPAAGDSPAAAGEIRVVKPGDRLRLTWQPDDWAGPATVQLALLESASGKTAIQAHLEKLPDGAAREAMRTRWRDALERVAAASR